MPDSYSLARERYAALGVDTENAINRLASTPLSLQCWQGDDVGGFENQGGLTGGIAATGNYPGKARNAEELRSDLEVAGSLIPGPRRGTPLFSRTRNRPTASPSAIPTRRCAVFGSTTASSAARSPRRWAAASGAP
jgi:hypothetical protein